MNRQKKRKKNSKLQTFTPRTITNREQNSRVKQLEEINKNAMQALKASGVTVQTCTYPLAMAYMEMFEQDQKAQFDQYCKNNLVHVSTLSPEISNVCLIADFMRYVHMPPPSDVATYSQYSDYLWSASLNSFIDKATTVVFVFDKPNICHLLEASFMRKGLRINLKIHNIQVNY